MRILLIEDEEKLSSAIKSGLEQETFVVDVADNGEDGLTLALEEEYDLIILDLMLPKMNGKQVCTSIRQHQLDVPVLMLTALTQIEDKVEGLNLGADDYLGKPFDFSELIARIHALTRRGNHHQLLLKFQDLVLDPVRMVVRRKEETINLSKKEFALLTYLLKNQNRILTKDQIIAHIWDFEANVLPNTVEVMIGNLRNKIDRPFNSQLIQTIRGFGYKIGEK